MSDDDPGDSVGVDVMGHPHQHHSHDEEDPHQAPPPQPLIHTPLHQALRHPTEHMTHFDHHDSHDHSHSHSHHGHHDDVMGEHHSHGHSHALPPMSQTPMLSSQGHMHEFHSHDFPPLHHHLNTPLHHPYSHSDHGPPPLPIMHHDHQHHPPHHDYQHHTSHTPLHHSRSIDHHGMVDKSGSPRSSSHHLPSNDFSLSPGLTGFGSPQLGPVSAEGLNSMPPLPPSVSPQLGSHSPSHHSHAMNIAHLTSFSASPTSPNLRSMPPLNEHLHGVIESAANESRLGHHSHLDDGSRQVGTDADDVDRDDASQSHKKGHKRKLASVNYLATKVQKLTGGRSVLRGEEERSERLLQQQLEESDQRDRHGHEDDEHDQRRLEHVAFMHRHEHDLDHGHQHDHSHEDHRHAHHVHHHDVSSDEHHPSTEDEARHHRGDDTEDDEDGSTRRHRRSRHARSQAQSQQQQQQQQQQQSHHAYSPSSDRVSPTPAPGPTRRRADHHRGANANAFELLGQASAPTPAHLHAHANVVHAQVVAAIDQPQVATQVQVLQAQQLQQAQVAQAAQQFLLQQTLLGVPGLGLPVPVPVIGGGLPVGVGVPVPLPMPALPIDPLEVAAFDTIMRAMQELSASNMGLGPNLINNSNTNNNALMSTTDSSQQQQQEQSPSVKNSVDASEDVAEKEKQLNNSNVIPPLHASLPAPSNDLPPPPLPSDMDQNALIKAMLDAGFTAEQVIGLGNLALSQSKPIVSIPPMLMPQPNVQDDTVNANIAHVSNAANIVNTNLVNTASINTVDLTNDNSTVDASSGGLAFPVTLAPTPSAPSVRDLSSVAMTDSSEHANGTGANPSNETSQIMTDSNVANNSNLNDLPPLDNANANSSSNPSHSLPSTSTKPSRSPLTIIDVDDDDDDDDDVSPRHSSSTGRGHAHGHDLSDDPSDGEDDAPFDSFPSMIGLAKLFPEFEWIGRSGVMRNGSTHHRTHAKPKHFDHLSILPPSHLGASGGNGGSMLPRKPRMIKCQSCDSTLSCETELYTHLMQVHNRCVCPNCYAEFPDGPSLKAHLVTHGKGRQYTCHFCGEGFNQSGHCKEHERIHTGERPYVCNAPGCDRSFSRKSYLKQHQRIHTGEKKFVCSLCQKSFRQSSTLKSHRRIHTGEKPYKCPGLDCGKVFRHGNTRKAHMLADHGQLLPIPATGHNPEHMTPEDGSEVDDDDVGTVADALSKMIDHPLVGQGSMTEPPSDMDAAAAVTANPMPPPSDATAPSDSKSILQQVAAGGGPSLAEIESRVAETGSVHLNADGGLTVEQTLAGMQQLAVTGVLPPDQLMQQMQHPLIIKHLENLALLHVAQMAAANAPQNNANNNNNNSNNNNIINGNNSSSLANAPLANSSPDLNSAVADTNMGVDLATDTHHADASHTDTTIPSNATSTDQPHIDHIKIDETTGDASHGHGDGHDNAHESSVGVGVGVIGEDVVVEGNLEHAAAGGVVVVKLEEGQLEAQRASPAVAPTPAPTTTAQTSEVSDAGDHRPEPEPEPEPEPVANSTETVIVITDDDATTKHTEGDLTRSHEQQGEQQRQETRPAHSQASPSTESQQPTQEQQSQGHPPPSSSSLEEDLTAHSSHLHPLPPLESIHGSSHSPSLASSLVPMSVSPDLTGSAGALVGETLDHHLTLLTHPPSTLFAPTPAAGPLSLPLLPMSVMPVLSNTVVPNSGTGNMMKLSSPPGTLNLPPLSPSTLEGADQSRALDHMSLGLSALETAQRRAAGEDVENHHGGDHNDNVMNDASGVSDSSRSNLHATSSLDRVASHHGDNAPTTAIPVPASESTPAQVVQAVVPSVEGMLPALPAGLFPPMLPPMGLPGLGLPFPGLPMGLPPGLPFLPPGLPPGFLPGAGGQPPSVEELQAFAALQPMMLGLLAGGQLPPHDLEAAIQQHMAMALQQQVFSEVVSQVAQANLVQMASQVLANSGAPVPPFALPALAALPAMLPGGEVLAGVAVESRVSEPTGDAQQQRQDDHHDDEEQQDEHMHAADRSHEDEMRDDSHDHQAHEHDHHVHHHDHDDDMRHDHHVHHHDDVDVDHHGDNVHHSGDHHDVDDVHHHHHHDLDDHHHGHDDDDVHVHHALHSHHDVDDNDHSALSTQPLRTSEDVMMQIPEQELPTQREGRVDHHHDEEHVAPEEEEEQEK